jgi:glucose-6-phosphate isomerase
VRPWYNENVLLTLHNDKPSSTSVQEEFQRQNVLEKLKSIDLRARRKGLESIDPSRNPLVRIGMEIDGDGRVTKNSYGVFNLPWQSQNHPEWPMVIGEELADIRKSIRRTHGVPLRYVIWAGMGGSAEDKSMYNAVGLLRRGPRLYVLDSTDPAKLKSILGDIERRSGQPLAEALKSTLVVGQALGMTSYEPVVNLEKLQLLYNRHKIDSTPNFIYMTLPDSLLDQFGRRGGYRKVELQPDNGNTTAGRHSSPMTRGSLYPLGLASVPLDEWMEGTWLRDEDVHTAWRLSAFLSTQAGEGRNKVTLLLPKEWSGAGLWTKQDFEESLGKRDDFRLKVVIGENVKLANYRPPKDPAQDRCFLALNVKGLSGDGQKLASLRRAGYPVAVLTLSEPLLSRYMQFIHYAVFGIGYLQQMNFVTQPSVELYKAITNRLHSEAQKAGGLDKTKEWISTQASARRVRYRGAVTLHYDRLPEELGDAGGSAPQIYAAIVKSLAADRRIEYGELTFFGDMRYSAGGKAVRKVLDRAADRVFRSALKMPADVYEGPAMNHSYHEMVIGGGRALSTVLISEKSEKIPAAEFTADYHRAQYLATQMALQERGRFVVSISVKDMEESSLAVLDQFFKEAAAALKTRSRAR